MEEYKYPVLQIKKLDSGATIPVRSTTHSAAYDLYALEEGIVPAGGKAIVGTGIAISIIACLPRWFHVYGSIRSRSGLSAKHSIEVGAGVIDQDYRGEIKVILYNHSDTDFHYSKGDRIAQLILEVHLAPPVIEVDHLYDVVGNSRGTGGFGSTGR